MPLVSTTGVVQAPRGACKGRMSTRPSEGHICLHWSYLPGFGGCPLCYPSQGGCIHCYIRVARLSLLKNVESPSSWVLISGVWLHREAAMRPPSITMFRQPKPIPVYRHQCHTEARSKSDMDNLAFLNDRLHGESLAL